MSKNPILLCILLILTSLTRGINLAFSFSKWVILAILLIFLGGIIIMFIYVTAISNTQKFFSPKLNEFLIVIIFISLTPINWSFSSSIFSLIELFNFNLFCITIIVAILLIALFLRVKLVESFKGALKSFL